MSDSRAIGVPLNIGTAQCDKLRAARHSDSLLAPSTLSGSLYWPSSWGAVQRVHRRFVAVTPTLA
jgi:hypothetical protein